MRGWKDSLPVLLDGAQALILNDLQTVNPALAEEWHPYKNAPLSPADVTIGSHRKVWWLGSCGHEWEAVVKSRHAGRGCPYCAGRLLLKGFNDLATTNPEVLQEWDYENNDINPNELQAGSHKKVWWKCKTGHSWQASPNHRISKGRGCPFCSHNPAVLKGENDLETVHPELLSEWDYDKNTDILPDNYYLLAPHRYLDPFSNIREGGIN